MHSGAGIPAAFVFRKGRPLAECQTRCFSALNQLAQETGPGRPIVVVAHQLVLASILLKILQLPLSMVTRLHQTNTAVNLLSYDGRWLVPPNQRSKPLGLTRSADLNDQLTQAVRTDNDLVIYTSRR